ncbi:Zinc finger protein 84 [Folsomia candida]|uniref:Zinc finger protein 84 n=1 Tax=Folsomia candida TaxID=158441 RepID=A0A226DJM9_FOLCA|nr:Zinc finger protein 84 [Folsomia candida]
MKCYPLYATRDDLPPIISNVLYCPKSFPTQGGANRHIRSHIRDDPNSSKSYQCHVTPCTKSFYTLNNLRGHVYRVHKCAKRFSCDFKNCPVTCKSKTALKVHQVTHTGVKNFKCGHPNCNKAYKTKGAVTQHHAAVHVAARPFRCSTCSKGFFSKPCLTRHVKGVHETIEAKFECTLCTTKFKTKEGLYIHITSHIGEKPYSCGTCSAGFRTSSSLKSHQYIHRAENKFLCEFCSKKFRRPGERRAHVRLVHPSTPHAPSDCPTCGKTFPNRTRLLRHVGLNHGDRTFFCYFCPKVVKNYKANFETHVRLHTHEKSFICTECKYSTGWPSALVLYRT